MEQEDISKRLEAVVAELTEKADKCVQERVSVEQRWLEDTRQYHGEEPADKKREREDEERSTIFVNLTGPKTDAMSARLADLLFPTDDRNWGIGPTPVPELTQNAKAATQAAREARRQQKQTAEEALAAQDEGLIPEARAAEAKAGQAEDVSMRMAAETSEGRKRAEAMAAVMDDQLKESRYHAIMRDVIEDGCRLGTGVCKGPIRNDRSRKSWRRTEAGYELSPSEQKSPGFRHVNLWSFFPVGAPRTIEEAEGVFERHLMNKAQLRKLQHRRGFDKDVIRELLRAEPRDTSPAYLADLRSITGSTTDVSRDLYQIWEYTGPLSAEQMVDLARGSGDEQLEETLSDEADPLQELMAVVWFCQGKVLNFNIFPYDRGEPIYSLFNLRMDEASVFGFGIPHMMRHPQSMLNAGARMMLDNAGVAAGPQIVIDDTQIKPMDGDYTMRPFKLWRSKDGIPKDEDHFRIYHINSHQAENANIMAIAQKHMDEETSMPQMAQGEQGSGITKTAQGMAILMNAANVVFRRIVKNFDDDVTVPNIRRLYDWNMQFNPRDDIKGDFEVDARGSSVLLVREMQAQNLRLFMLEFGTHPVYGPMLKHADGLRKSVQALLLPADELIKTNDEIEDELEANRKRAEEAATASGEQGPDPAAAALKERELAIRETEIMLKAEMANMDMAKTIEVETLRRDTALIQLAEKGNMEMDTLLAKMNDKQADRDHEMRKIDIEAMMTLRTGQTAGGLV